MTDVVVPPPNACQFNQELHHYFIDLFGKERTHRLALALRQPGTHYFLRTNTLQTTSEALVKQLESENISAIVADPELNAVAIPIRPAGPVPHHDHFVVADKTSSENVLLGSHLFYPGVKRTTRFDEGTEVTVVNPKGHSVGSGVAQVASKHMTTQHHGIAVKITNPYYTIPSIADLDTYQKGLFYSQSYPAMLVAPTLDPQPNDTIIDFCAAPGGKTTHIAQLLNNQGRIIAVDRSRRRIDRLIAETARMGISCITPFVGRAKEFVAQHPALQADRVLVDPPCTALGVRPKLYDETTLKRIQSTASYQRNILESALHVLRPGGILVYSTCTLTVEENEHNISHLVDSFGFSLEEQSRCHGTIGLTGNALFRQRVQRIYPDIHDLPGYFIAKLRKPNH